ncbi:MAG: hypothetical protein IJ689_07125 [Alphaproteobacteria bacterium]|nr:hypothetical protein [Alphaproteobacteria bacterium]
MNKYILMLGVAGVALGSYCAYAGNSATMTVTATIAHDVSLTVTQDIDLGTITINPAYTEDDTDWEYSDSGVIMYNSQGAIVSASNATVGTFTANIPNPSACNTDASTCEGLSLRNGSSAAIGNLFGGDNNSNECSFTMKYSGSGNSFKIYPSDCLITDVSKATPGSHSGTLTISYTASQKRLFCWQ